MTSTLLFPLKEEFSLKNNLYSYVKSPKLGDKSSMEYF
ncbi:hypothetical protein CLC_0625 [Clostridium botulinum A str. Hall]|nr:hypothetical protein CLB_0609 [Clostridium botulinum A str. ATCC 19397]ABS38521.1 hypothetical protein CLC_0625 [Clostridium botulinum A str. Hall]KON10266.1 hypothetical protein ACP52_05555 [Clostridium botulinum]KOR53857.1 hypothetical protein ADT23_02795 [Clostridium botulinum]